MYNYTTAAWYYYISGTTPSRTFYDYGNAAEVSEEAEF
jgi:hypothetical protein